MRNFIFISVVIISGICFISCEKDTQTTHSTSYECTSCATEECVCSHKDSTSNVCASCGMENCSMGCSAN